MPDRSSASLALYVRFPPSWEHIEPLRQYTEVSVKARTGGRAADKASIVVQELLENAVKYGVPAEAVEFEIHMSDSGSGLDVCVRNTAHPSRLVVLEREFARIQAEPGGEAFNKALQRAARLPQGSTMLGLPRVAMESTLQLEIKGDRVEIVAHVEVGVRSATRQR